MDLQHVVMKSCDIIGGKEGVLWCVKCGSYSECSVRGLAKECRGYALRTGKRNIQLLEAGWHPRQMRRLEAPKAVKAGRAGRRGEVGVGFEGGRELELEEGEASKQEEGELEERGEQGARGGRERDDGAGPVGVAEDGGPYAGPGTGVAGGGGGQGFGAVTASGAEGRATVAGAGEGTGAEDGAGQPWLEQEAFPEPPDEEYWGEICGGAPGREEEQQREAGRPTGNTGAEAAEEGGGAMVEGGQMVGGDQGAAGGWHVLTQEERRGKRRNVYSMGGVVIGETVPKEAYTACTLGSNKRSMFKF